MISVEDSLTTYEYEDYFKILPAINNWCDDENRIKLGDKVPNGFEYDSGTNQETMSKKELISWIKENMEHLGENLMIPYGRGYFIRRYRFSN